MLAGAIAAVVASLIRSMGPGDFLGPRAKRLWFRAAADGPRLRKWNNNMKRLT